MRRTFWARGRLRLVALIKEESVGQWICENSACQRYPSVGRHGRRLGDSICLRPLEDQSREALEFDAAW
jgi:hypothetical protein